MSISINAKEFLQEYSKGSIQSKLIELSLEDKKITAIPRSVQVHPVTDIPQHIDFQEIGKDTSVKVSVHLKILNEDKAPGIKKGGALNVVQRIIPCYCHPKNIPSHLEVDIGALEIGTSLHINDIKLPEGLMPVDKSNFAVLSLSGRIEESAETPTAQETQK